jgi:hypothetical protein
MKKLEICDNDKMAYSAGEKWLTDSKDVVKQKKMINQEACNENKKVMACAMHPKKKTLLNHLSSAASEK